MCDPLALVANKVRVGFPRTGICPVLCSDGLGLFTQLFLGNHGFGIIKPPQLLHSTTIALHCTALHCTPMYCTGVYCTLYIVYYIIFNICIY